MARLGPDRADALRAALWCLAGVIPVLLVAPARQQPAGLAIVIGQAVGLARRRRRPLLGWCLAFAPIIPVTFLAAGAGHGLIGMRERVLAFGGELSAGPRDGGGFAVRARITRHAETEEAA